MPSTVVTPTTSGISAARPRKNTQREQQQQRKRQHLRAAEVLGDRLADLQSGNRRAADRHVRVARERVERILRDLVTVGPGLDYPRHQRAALRHAGRARGGDAGCCGELRGSRLRVVVVDEQDDPRRGLLPGRALELPVGPGGLRRRRREAATGIQPAGDRPADNPGEHYEREQEKQCAPRPSGGETCETSEHACIVDAARRANIGSRESLPPLQLLPGEYDGSRPACTTAIPSSARRYASGPVVTTTASRRSAPICSRSNLRRAGDPAELDLHGEHATVIAVDLALAPDAASRYSSRMRRR